MCELHSGQGEKDIRLGQWDMVVVMEQCGPVSAKRLETKMSVHRNVHVCFACLHFMPNAAGGHANHSLALKIKK